jgi:hypothetical protein
VADLRLGHETFWYVDRLNSLPCVLRLVWNLFVPPNGLESRGVESHEEASRTRQGATVGDRFGCIESPSPKFMSVDKSSPAFVFYGCNKKAGFEIARLTP